MVLSQFVVLENAEMKNHVLPIFASIFPHLFTNQKSSKYRYFDNMYYTPYKIHIMTQNHLLHPSSVEL